MIKDLTAGRVHKTSLFVQPEFKCNVGCKGCYAIKGKKMDYGEVTHCLDKFADIVEGIRENKIEFDQITLSMNDLTREEAGDTATYADLLGSLDVTLHKDKIHLACAINSLMIYRELVDFSEFGVLNISIDEGKILKFTEDTRSTIQDMISDIKDEYHDLHINVNLMIGSSSTQSINQSILDSVYEIVDSVHLVMEKPTNGHGYNLYNFEFLERFKKDFEAYIKHAIAIRDTYGSKIDIDTCVSTVISNLVNDTQYSCRAGVNHVSMWADGKFTGCPYRMPDSEYVIEFEDILKFKDFDTVEKVDGAEYNFCLYGEVQYLYETFDGLCKALGITGKAIEILKGAG